MTDIILSSTPYTPVDANNVVFEFSAPSFSGREMYVAGVGGAVLLGLRETNPTINSAPIDITDINSNGFRELLDESGEWSYSVSVTGITKDAALRSAILTGLDISLAGFAVYYEDGEQVAGDYKLTNYSDAAPYNDAITFSATLELSGQKTGV